MLYLSLGVIFFPSELLLQLLLTFFPTSMYQIAPGEEHPGPKDEEEVDNVTLLPSRPIDNGKDDQRVK